MVRFRDGAGDEVVKVAEGALVRVEAVLVPEFDGLGAQVVEEDRGVGGRDVEVVELDRGEGRVEQDAEVGRFDGEGVERGEAGGESDGEVKRERSADPAKRRARRSLSDDRRRQELARDQATQIRG